MCSCQVIHTFVCFLRNIAIGANHAANSAGSGLNTDRTPRHD